MKTLIIGKERLTVQEVTTIIQESPSFAHLQERWRSFAYNLGVKNAEIPGLQRKIDTGALLLTEVPREILYIWKAEQGEKATLEVMYKALESTGLGDISGALEATFFKVKSEEITFVVQNEVSYTLKDLFEDHVPESISQMVINHQNRFLSTEPIRILRKEVYPMEEPKYYVRRTFLHKTELNGDILKADTLGKHVFLVKGIDKNDLARACGYQKIERSGNQLETTTARFILLECDDDFDTIGKIPGIIVHMIEYQNNTFFHLKSTGGFGSIQNFIKNDGIIFDEEEAANRVRTTVSPSAVGIADSPGMGKTFALTHIAWTIKTENPNAIVLFIEMQEFLKHGHSLESTSTVLNAISTYATSDELSKSILQEMMKGKKFPFYIFMDGYDEVLHDKLEAADNCLTHLRNTPNVTLVVTTRPHQKPSLENILQRLSLEILPFNQSNQLQFLSKYWVEEHEAKEGKMLDPFAKQCLETLVVKMTDKEKDIAGVPLQCLMRAEVYAAHAKRASSLKTLPEDVVKITSFFEMYKSLMKHKFDRISKFGYLPELLQKDIDAHVHDSIALLFPRWLEKFKSLMYRREEVDDKIMYSIGLIEKTPSSNTSRFLHRTFAENLLAEFIVWNLDKHQACMEFFYTEILGNFGVNIEERRESQGIYKPTLFKLKHPVIAYFVDMHLKNRFANKSLNDLSSLNFENISEKNLCIAANACCCHDLESCFELTTKILRKMDLKDLDLRKTYFKHLPFLAVENAENDSLVKKVIDFTKIKFGVGLDWHVFGEAYKFKPVFSFEIKGCTPLHVAVNRGNYNIARCLCQEYGQDVLSIKYLMHACVYDSADNLASVIQDKVAIIEYLAELNREWVKECCEENDLQPILMENVHVRLVECLIRLGADINARELSFGTVLHRCKNKKMYPSLLRFVLENGFNLINHPNNGHTPIKKAIRTFDTLDDDVLHLFSNAKANFNFKNADGDTVLFDAIEFSKNADFVKKIVDFGADINSTNTTGRNAAHLTLNCFRDHPTLALELLNSLLSQGFQGIHQKNQFGLTPFQDAIVHNIVNDKFLEHMAKMEPDEDGNSLLLLTVKYSMDMDIIAKVLDFLGNPNIRNYRGENAAHFVMKQYECRLKATQLMKSYKLDKMDAYNFLNYDRFERKISKKVDTSSFVDVDGYSLFPYVHWQLTTKKFFGFTQFRNFYSTGDFPDGLSSNQSNYLGIKDVLKLLDSKGFIGLNQKDLDGITPFQLALKYRLVNEELIPLFCKAEPDEDGNTVLFHALQYSKDFGLIKKILNVDVSLGHQNKKRENAAHLAIKYYRFNPKNAVQILEILTAKGFTGFHQKDKKRLTPLDLARKLDIKDEQLLMFLEKNSKYDRSTLALFVLSFCFALLIICFSFHFDPSHDSALL